ARGLVKQPAPLEFVDQVRGGHTGNSIATSAPQPAPGAGAFPQRIKVHPAPPDPHSDTAFRNPPRAAALLRPTREQGVPAAADADHLPSIGRTARPEDPRAQGLDEGRIGALAAD